MAFNFSDLEAQRFQEDLQRAATYKPIVKEDLKKAYSRYKDVGVKLGRVKGKSDAQLYRMATQDVINWWKKSKSKPAAPRGTAPNSGLPRGGATPSSGSGGSSGSGSSGSGSRSSSGGFLLPNTSTTAKGTAPKKLPSIPRPLSQSYMNQVYARYGIVGARPPSYVLKNQDTFDAWIQRVLRARASTEYRQQAAAGPTRTATTTTRYTSRPRVI